MGVLCWARMNGYMFKTGVPLPHANIGIPEERVVRGEGLSLDCLANSKLLLKVPRIPPTTCLCFRPTSGQTTMCEESPQASLVAQMVKNLPAMKETRVQSLGWEDPLEKGMATHSSILAWRIPRTEEPGGLQSMGSQRVRHN